MSRRIRSRTKIRRLKPIFATEDPELGPLLARLSVLYEDLRIEVYGATREDIEELDGNSAIYRKFYFLRRSTITLTEFEGVVQELNKNKSFRALRKSFRPEQEERWVSANLFFGNHHGLLQAVRNDCGGHYQLATARAVVRDQLHDDTTGMMEVDYGPTGDDATVYLRFAYELAAASLVLQKPQDEGLREFAEELFSVVWDGWGHVVKVIHAIAGSVFVPAFGL